MNTKTDEGLYEKARKLFISKASIDEFAGWATPRQVDAVHRVEHAALHVEILAEAVDLQNRPIRSIPVHLAPPSLRASASSSSSSGK